MASALHLFLNNPLHSEVNLILLPSFSKVAHLFIVVDAPLKQSSYLLPWGTSGQILHTQL